MLQAEILPHLQGLKRFYLPKEHGQTGWKSAKENRNRSQGFTEYFNFHCLLSFVVVTVTVVVFTFSFFKQVYAHTDSIYLSASKLLVITLRIIKYSLPQEEPSESPPVKKLAWFYFLIKLCLAILAMLGSLRWTYWLVPYFHCCLLFVEPRTKIWTWSFRSKMFKTWHAIFCCLQNLFQLAINKLNIIPIFFLDVELPRHFFKVSL